MSAPLEPGDAFDVPMFGEPEPRAQTLFALEEPVASSSPTCTACGAPRCRCRDRGYRAARLDEVGE